MRRVALLIAGLALSGCDSVTNQAAEMALANEPTIVISAGYQVTTAGHPARIQGFDACPTQEGAVTKLFGAAPDEGQSTCIVLGRDRTTVPVLIALPSGAVREEWSIHRESGKTQSGRPFSRTSLQRPDGSLVVLES